MSRHRLDLGFSPCPNDTFMFHALVHGAVTVPGLHFEPHLLDIEELNRRALSTRGDHFPVTKLSAAVLARVSDRYVALRSGAALGRGVGPLVVVRDGASTPAHLANLAGARVAVPGLNTTAHLLLATLGPKAVEVVECRFDQILASVASGEVDAGVIIHESRFTYADHGLRRLADLGELWEEATGLPLPLGLIAVDRALPLPLRRAIERGIAASVRYAFTLPEASQAWVRSHAQEMDPAVCAQHIALYVNESSVDLGGEGRRAVEALFARAREAGLAPAGPAPFQD